MRVSTSQMFDQSINEILDQQSRVLDTQMQIATGKNIVNPSDDPAGAVQLMGLRESIEITTQYQENALFARSRQELEDTTLTGVVDSLQRARDLAVQGLNDTLSEEDRAAIAVEVRQILDQVMGLANTKDANGEYLFAGFQSQSVPFTTDGVGTFSFDGDQGQRLLQIGPTRQIAVGDSGFDVFMKVEDATGTGYQDVFSTLYNLATDLEANAPNEDSLTEIDNAMTSMLDHQAKVGARLNSIDGQELINEDFLLQLQETRSEIEDLDYAEAAVRLSEQMLILEAAQQSFVQVQGLSLFNYL